MLCSRGQFRFAGEAAQGKAGFEQAEQATLLAFHRAAVGGAAVVVAEQMECAEMM